MEQVAVRMPCEYFVMSDFIVPLLNQVVILVFRSLTEHGYSSISKAHTIGDGVGFASSVKCY